MLASIVLIEGVILVPSYRNFERDLLRRLEDVGAAAVGPLLHDADKETALDRTNTILLGGAPSVRLRGVAIYDADGRLLAARGEAPAPRPDAGASSPTRNRTSDKARYDLQWKAGSAAAPFYVGARLDSIWIVEELAAFVWRIAGLVLMISAFVTLTTMLILARWVIVPILRLRENIMAAAEDPSHPDLHAVEVCQDDELGDVMTAFNTMLADVTSTQRREIERVVAMTENSIAASFAYDVDGTLVYSNGAALALCGAANKDSLVQSGCPRVIIAPDDSELRLAEYLRRDPFTEEVMLRAGAVRRIPCLVSGNHLRGADGQPALYFASVLNFTEMHKYRAQLEQQNIELESANRAKTDFLANMSHELRTPLNAIIGFSEVMAKQLLGPLGNEKYRQYVEDIHASGTHLLSIISDILDLSKIEAGKVTLVEESLDAHELVASALRLVREKAEEGVVTLRTEIANDLPLLCADQRIMKQLLLNLLSNAVKFTEAGGEVTIAVAADKDGFVLEVRDTGIGIAEDDVARALSPFGQIDSYLTRRHEGTGLGLSLVRSFVALHGGTLGIDSALGKGTTVTVRFGRERIRAHEAIAASKVVEQA